jgi:hypothetical protein
MFSLTTTVEKVVLQQHNERTNNATNRTGPNGKQASSKSRISFELCLLPLMARSGFDCFIFE